MARAPPIWRRRAPSRSAWTRTRATRWRATVAVGNEVAIVWRGRRARAFVPIRLADRDLRLEADTVARVARAEAAVERGAETLPEDYAALARLLLRAEGVDSSFIEG
jgi:hypothetical protein